MTVPSIPFDSYFDQQGQDNILNKLMDFKANRWQNAVGQGFQGLNTGLHNISDQDRKKQLIQKLAMAMQNSNQPQQGPPAPAGPAIQGPQGYVPPGAGPSAVPAGQTPMQQNPTSGMGAPTGQDSSQIIGTLLQMDPSGELVQKLIAQRMGLNQSPMNPLQQSEIMKNQSEAKKNSLIDPQAQLKEKQLEFKQRMAEIANQKEQDRQVRELIAKLAAGNRSDIAGQGNQLKSQIANANHPMLNGIRKLFGMSPVVDTQSNGGPQVTNVQVTQ